MEKILKNLELSTEEFVDLCILLGCDYCPTIRGIGRKKSFELIQKHRNIETILDNIDQTVRFLSNLQLSNQTLQFQSLFQHFNLAF